jgi:CBS domain-containing protein
MRARDIMTSSVITVGPHASVSDIAKLLLESRISAVPVVDEAGKLVGMVSEGDLMRRADLGTQRQGSWWLTLFGEPERAAEYVKTHGQKARDIMTTELITVGVNATVSKIAFLLEKNRIKRVPVTENGELVGLVSRANLIRPLAAGGGVKEVAGNDAAIREEFLKELMQAGLRTYLMNVIVENGVAQVFGLVRSEAEKNAIRVASENVAGILEVKDETSFEPELAEAPWIRPN